MAEDLCTQLDDDSARPYFLWSEEMSLGQLREILAGSQGDYLRWVYSGRILREARMAEVWQFFTPGWIARHWDHLSPHLGRRREFWRH